MNASEDDSTTNSKSIQIIKDSNDKAIGAISKIESVIEEDGIRLKCYYVRLHKKDLEDSFEKGIVNVKSQTKPIQIEILVNDELTESFKDVWLDKISYAYSTKEFILADCIEMKGKQV